MLGCMTYIESTSGLTVVGEEMVVGTVRQVWQTALKTYTTTLNERVSKASIKSREVVGWLYPRGLLPGTRMAT